MPLRNGHETRSQSYATLANPRLYTKSILKVKLYLWCPWCFQCSLSLSRMISSVQGIISVTSFVDNGADDVFEVVVQVHHNLPMSGWDSIFVGRSHREFWGHISGIWLHLDFFWNRWSRLKENYLFCNCCNWFPSSSIGIADTTATKTSKASITFIVAFYFNNDYSKGRAMSNWILSAFAMYSCST